MRLYLMRHGKAEKKSPTGRDEDRPLQPRGERQSKWMAQTMLAAAPIDRPTLLLHSPAVRAVATAAILHDTLRCERRVETRLSLGHPADDVLDLIAELAGERSGAPGAVVLVGHNPQMEILLTSLVPGLADEASEMRTGEAALMEIPPGAAAGQARLLARLRLEE
jgi:phosphohistidine phosphatase